jgi:hypothetical protein
MEILVELSKRGGGYVRSARQTRSPARRDRYLELAAHCFTTAAKRAESLIGRDIGIMVGDDRDADSRRLLC